MCIFAAVFRWVLMMGKQIRIIAILFSFLIITIIGNLVYAPSLTDDKNSLFDLILPTANFRNLSNHPKERFSICQHKTIQIYQTEP